MLQTKNIDSLFNHPGLTGLSAPARAYVLAKSAFEAMRDVNFAEQRAALVAATADDPQPVEPSVAAEGRTGWLAWKDRYDVWRERNQARIDAATLPVVALYPRELEELAQLAEQNLVDYAEEQIAKRYGPRADSLQPAFAAYREGKLYGDMRERFIQICFNCPAA